MGLACCCRPPLFGAGPPMALHTSLLCTLAAFFARAFGPHCMGQAYPCIPLAPSPPSCHRRRLRLLLVFLPCNAPSLSFLSYPKPSCTAPERHPILQNLSRERRKQACSCIVTLHQHTYGPPHIYQPTLAYLHSTLSLVAPWPCSLLLPLLFFFFSQSQKPPSQTPNCGPAGDGTDLTAQTPHVWLAQRPPPPPPSFMLVPAVELRSTAQ